MKRVGIRGLKMLWNWLGLVLGGEEEEEEEEEEGRGGGVTG